MLEATVEASPEAVLNHVRAALPTPSEWYFGDRYKQTAFHGKCNESGFWVATRRSRWERSSFNPILVVQVSPISGGCRIIARTRLARPVQIFSILWLGTAIFLCVAGLFDLANSGVVINRNTGLLLAILAPAVLFTVGVAYFMIRDMRKKRGAVLEAWLREQLARLDNFTIIAGTLDGISKP